MDRSEAERQAKEYFEHARREMFPKMRQSAFSVSLCPIANNGEPDAKFCLELGAAIMYDKPIFAVARPGWPVPDQLRRVADVVCVADMNTEEGKAILADQLAKFVKRLGLDKKGET